ncbi:MAG: hypothetical protein Q9167_003040 [Letrouitia subvulpina]
MAADLNKNNVSTYSEKDSQDDSGVRYQASAFRASPWWKFGGRDRIFIPIREETSEIHPEDGGIAADESVFSNVKARDIYKPIDKYEGRHRFDVNATWTDDEEKKLVQRTICLVYVRIVRCAICWLI